MPSSVKGLPLSEAVFAYLDTETTGLSAKSGGRVCELAVVSAQGGRDVAKLSTLIDPQSPVQWGALAVHGISDAMLKGQPTFAQVADELAAHLDGKILVAHNAGFDVAFLQAEFARLGRTMPEVTVLCTLKLARRHFKFPSNRLGAIAEALGVKMDAAHRAHADAQALRAIFERFLSDFDKRGVKTVSELIAL
ncbi:MAG: 3'-5' exonuclease [Elusimicrobia bacterium]|nr:3'-5' exonuclease [Elusimicrobiota bacterium]